MVRSEKVIIFNGPKAAFDGYISEYYKHDGNNYNCYCQYKNVGFPT